MIRYTQGNLLETRAEAVVNTVNTVGVMGKGIALMFKDRFPDNYRQYRAACKAGEVQTGRLFITEPNELGGPRWVVNFPTKQDWRAKSRLEWISAGLIELRRFLQEQQVRSIAVPPLGAGNGGLEWPTVRAEIEQALRDVDAEIIVFEPTATYQNVAKRSGVQKLTPARALIAELVRRYSILGFECSLLEIQKLAWFLERAIRVSGAPDPLDLRFAADRYGPYAHRLTKLLDSLDGSYLHCDKRLADAGPLDAVWFERREAAQLDAYLMGSEAAPYRDALESVSTLIDGFESPYGMELLATVDWLVSEGGVAPDATSVRHGLSNWPAGQVHAARKTSLFDESSIDLALRSLRAWLSPGVACSIGPH
jgi:O-acetyl-ADP-ribose deacetylase (regulator of RNase III)